MGMMDMGAMPQQMPQQAPQQGMMGGQPPQQAGNPSTSHGKYNGTIDVQGQPVEVKAGVAEVEGQPYMVSDDGALVVSSQGQLVGHVENGKFVVITPEYHDQMMKAGFLQ
jgi:hypothetical protein